MIIKGLAAEVTDFVHHGGSSHRKTESQVKPPVIWNIKPVGFPVDGQSREFQLPFQYQSLQECLLGSLKPNDSFHLLHFPILENRHVLRWAASSTGLPFPNFFPWSFPFSAAGQLRKSGQSLGKNICIINSSEAVPSFPLLMVLAILAFQCRLYSQSVLAGGCTLSCLLDYQSFGIMSSQFRVPQVLNNTGQNVVFFDLHHLKPLRTVFYSFGDLKHAK